MNYKLAGFVSIANIKALHHTPIIITEMLGHQYPSLLLEVKVICFPNSNFTSVHFGTQVDILAPNGHVCSSAPLCSLQEQGNIRSSSGLATLPCVKGRGQIESNYWLLNACTIPGLFYLSLRIC